MDRLDKNRYLTTLEVYRKNELFFPLIATVLQGTQDGVVFVDNADKPAQFYVEHSFGFAQLFGQQVPSFEQELWRYLLVDSSFSAEKVRLYGVYAPDFLNADHEKSSLSFRQRFKLGETFVRSADVLAELPHRSGIETVAASRGNITLIEEKFGVVFRFWRDSDEFIAYACAAVVLVKGEPAAICYSAATADQCAEIDVMTLPEFRKMGLGKLAVAEFVETCKRQNIDPLWDCFANNTASMMLAESIGYLPFCQPYNFYTINRQ